jgi:hypothetical protein
MKQKTSNSYMERPEDLLTTIKKAQPDSQLYAAIRQRIKNRELEATPWSILRIAAILCGVFLCVEAYVISTPTVDDMADEITLVSVNSNTLYDDNE